MRIVVVGATGNIGTALLRRLHAAEGVDIVGVARREPAPVAPYAGVEWATVDIGRPDAAPALTEVFRGADAVVHLAWALQPNHDETAMRATNVAGTARVLTAVAAASVPHLVVSSSVGAYSFGPKGERVDESWPTGGIATSQYSRQKAANERALDRFEAQHPGVLVTRVRPGLVFQASAGAEQRRLFLGRLIPVEVLQWWRPPVLPFPSLGIFQAVHADDLADAFWRIIDRRVGGGFNIAAEPVSRPPTPSPRSSRPSRTTGAPRVRHRCTAEVDAPLRRGRDGVGEMPPPPAAHPVSRVTMSAHGNTLAA
ncbi:MAG: epimerase [Microbacterium sp.]|nr:epimerase [Microbacterium sp.]